MSDFGKFMEEELYSQPQMWHKVTLLDSSVLPKKGEKVVVIGCGTSWFMAQAYATLREQSGHGITDAYTATEVAHYRDYDVAIVITRSGTTSEIIDFLEKNNAREEDSRLRSIALLGDIHTPVAQLADSVVDLSFADEKSVVQTRFATTALTYLRSSLVTPDIIEKSIADAEKVLSLPVDPQLVNQEQYSFLGSGWVLGLATEAALKMRESCQAWTESYHSMEYRHGPIAIAAPGRITWQLGDSPAGLAAEVARTGALYIDEDLDPLAALVKVHQVALETSRARQLNADQPRNLSRSVILDKDDTN